MTASNARRFRAVASCAIALFLLWASTSPASAVAFGDLNVASGAVALSSSGIDFTTNSSTGTFVGLAGTLANTSDVSFAAPSGANFITFQASPAQAINLTGMSGGAFTSVNCFAAPAAGQTCTPPGTPLSFVNTPTGAVVSFSVQGTATTSIDSPTAISGVYTMQLAGTNYQSVLATLAGGGTVSTTYSAEFSGTSGRFTLGGSLTLSSTGVDFTPTTVIGVPDPNRFIVGSPATGSFVGLPLTSGIAADLLYASTPPGDPVSVANFLIFLAAPALQGSLTLLEEGVFSAAECGAPPAIGQTCTPADSALMFANVPGGSVAIFDVRGLFSEIGVSPYVGVFSLQFDMTYQALLALIADQQAVTGLYSASFTTDVPVTPTPEPTALVFLVTGGVALAIPVSALGRRIHRASRRSGVA